MAYRISSVVAPLALCLALSPVSAQSFEGVVTMRTAEKGQAHDVEYQVKDGKLRIEAEGRGGGAAVVLDPANQKMLIMMTGQKMYMERSLAGAGGAATRSAQQAAARATVTATGRKETIAGHECEHVEVTDDDGSTVDVCFARGMGAFMMAPAGNPMAGGAPGGGNGWGSKLGNDAFPLKVTKGSTVVLEVTKIEKKSLDASLFAPPEGWRKFDMPSIPGFRPPGA